MLKDSPNLGTKSITLRNDSRVLPFGKYLRISKINEIPQLFNILVGDLSYYSKVGFKRIVPKKISFEGPVNFERVLYIEFNKSIIEDSLEIKINKFID